MHATTLAWGVNLLAATPAVTTDSLNEVFANSVKVLTTNADAKSEPRGQQANPATTARPSHESERRMALGGPGNKRTDTRSTRAMKAELCCHRVTATLLLRTHPESARP